MARSDATMKKILLVFCMGILVFALSLGGYAKADTKNYYGYTADDLKENSESLYTSLIGFTEEELEQFRNSDDQITSKAVQSYIKIRDKIGDYVGISDFEIEEDKDILITKLSIAYSKRDVVLTVVYDSDLAVTSILTEMNYTLGEKMLKAGQNTIIGIVTVFLVLILISFLIWLFKYINKRDSNRKTNEVKQLGENLIEPVLQPIVSQEESVDDLELIAVIAAAIAASTHSSPEEFIVRSIKRRTTK